MKATVTIDIEYEDHAKPDPKDAEYQLEYAIQHLASNGMLSGADGDQNIEIKTWNVHVEIDGE